MRTTQLTEHAQRRKQQRGIQDLQLQLLELFGVDYYQKGGCSLSFIPERMLADLRNAIDKLHNVALVKGENDQGITVMHITKHIRKTGYAA